MKTNTRNPAPLCFLLSAAIFMPGCGIFAAITAHKQAKEHQAEVERQVAEAKAQAVVAQREADRAQKLAKAQAEYLESALDAQVYAQSCKDLNARAEKVLIKMGQSVLQNVDDMLVTSWSHVAAEYSTDYDYRLRKTRSASRSRYVVELRPHTDGCRVDAVYQYSDENGRDVSDRATEFESALLKDVSPEKYAAIEQGLDDIEKQYPPEKSGTTVLVSEPKT